MIWMYQQPVQIYFGDNERFKLREIMKRCGFKRAVFVCDKELVGNTAVSELINHVSDLIVASYSDVRPNPTVVNVDDCANLIRKGSADCVIALGGGSTMDCAKAAAAIAMNSESITRYHGTGTALPVNGLPVIQIPSTAGTGSEVTAISVLTDEAKGLKTAIGSDSLYAMVAIVDPVLTCTMPSRVAAITGLDVLAHAIEGYQSINHQPLCDLFCIEAVKLVFTNLRSACQSVLFIEAKEKMALASLLAGLGFNLPKTGPSHACSYVLTNQYHIPHGEACALTLDYFLEIIGTADDGRMLQMAKACGFESVSAIAKALRDLKKDLGIRMDLKDFKLNDEEIDALVEASQHPNMLNSPVKITKRMLRDLYNSMR